MTPTVLPFVPCPSCGRDLPIVLDERYPSDPGVIACPLCGASFVPPGRAELLRRFPPQVDSRLEPASTPLPTSEPLPASAPVKAAGPSGSFVAPGARAASGEWATERLYKMASLYGGGYEEIDRGEVWLRIRRGEIDASTDLCAVGTKEWRKVGQFPELARLLSQHARSAPPPVTPGGSARGGRRATADGSSMGIVEAGLRRWLARTLDLIICVLGTALMLVACRAGRHASREQLVVPLLLSCGLYSVLFTALQGRTPGKMLFGLRVVDGQGGTPGVVAALLRFVFDWIQYVAAIGFFFFLLGDQRTLADRVAGTRVVKE